MANYNNFSPILGVARGQAVADSISRAEAEGRALQEQLALKRAAGQIGEMPYYAGFEGEPGAQRPNFLRELYQQGNLKDAMAVEGLLTSTLGVNRDIKKAGEIERLKKEADAKVYMGLIDRFMGGDASGGGVNMFERVMGGSTQEGPIVAQSQEAQVTTAAPSGNAPEAPSIPGPQGGYQRPITAPTPRLSGEESGVESSFEVTPYGPKLGFKKMSPFEKKLKTSEDETRRQTAQTGSDAEKRQALQAAHDNVRRITTEITNTNKLMQNRDIPWEEGLAQIEELRRELDLSVKERDQLLSGKVAPTPVPAPVAPIKPPSVGALPATPKPSIAGPPKFTEKEQAAMDMKNREEEIAAANKEIVNARLGAEKILKYKRQINELFDLVTKNDIGHPSMEGIPLSENILTMDKTNAQVKKLAEGIINMFSEPGQSQMMNTIVERQMQGAVVPNLFSDPQLNKQNAAILRSNVEHLQTFPGFLEKWKKSHNGTLEGAADAWIDYTENNPLYIFEKDKRGKVTVKENPHVYPWPQWLKKREQEQGRRTRVIRGRTFIEQEDGSWMEQQ